MVICNMKDYCDEARLCGGAEPHDLCSECNKCPMDLTAQCIEIEDSENE